MYYLIMCYFNSSQISQVLNYIHLARLPQEDVLNHPRDVTESLSVGLLQAF